MSGLDAAVRVSRLIPFSTGAGLARFVVARNFAASRRAWLIFLSGFVEPVLYLFTLGVGLGAVIGTVPSDAGSPVPYAAFVAPGMLAVSAMQGAIFDSTFNVFFKLRYARLYDAMLATPMGPRDIAVGEIAWSMLRGTLYSAIFLVVAVAAGLVQSWWGVLALPGAMLVGLTFSAVGMFATTFMTSWQHFEYISLVMQPLFLFSATFFPLSVYPLPVQWLVQVTPLYQGVSLCRELMLGEVGWGTLGHVGYLLAISLVGMVGAARRIEKLLLT